MSGWSDLVALNDRFWSKVDDTADEGCWPWTGYRNAAGYGRFGYGGRTYQAHRVAYELSVGIIPDGLQLDHLCRNRSCVNPAHLEPVTCRVNVLRGVGPSAVNASKTECYRGHPLSKENVAHSTRGVRLCLECNRAKATARYAADPESERQRSRSRYEPRATPANSVKRECVNGHPFDAANTRRNRNGSRSCRECNRLVVARRRLREWMEDPK